MSSGTWFTLLLAVVSAVLLASSVTLSPLGRIAPLAVLVPTMTLAFLKLWRDLRRKDQPEVELTPAQLGRRLRIALWITGLALLVYLVGFLPAATIFLLAYLRVEGAVSWRTSLLVTGGTVAVIYATFALLAGLRFPEGVIF